MSPIKGLFRLPEPPLNRVQGTFLNLAWAIKRIRAMELAEIGNRIWQLLFQSVEAFVLSVGWRPQINAPKQMDKAIFQVSDVDIAKSWNNQFEWNSVKLDRLTGGRIDLFSYENVKLGTPPDWLTEPVNGIKSPSSYGKRINYRQKEQVGDIKILWELGRHQHLVPLAVGYFLTRNMLYKETIGAHIKSWMESCPFGYTVHWCSSLEVALRIISWGIVHGLLVLGGEKRGLFSLVDDEKHLRDVIYQHAWFIRHYLSLYSSANNHLIGELTGLWSACSIFNLGSRGKKWAEYANQFLEKEAEKQVHPDGVNKEQAVYYHYWVLEYLMFAHLVGMRVGHGFSEQFIHTITKMTRFLDALVPGDGAPPQIGDADDGYLARFSVSGRDAPFRDILSACNMLNNKKNKLTEKSFWYALMAAKDPIAVVTDEAVEKINLPCLFEDGGYAVLGDDKVRVVFDAGPLGYTSIAAHGHADALSVCLALEGVWWLVDSGTYTYHDNPEWRNYFRSTAAHNTVVVDDTDQSKIGGDFLWLDHANAQFLCHGVEDELQWVKGAHDGYGRVGVIHEREIEYFWNERRLKVTDRLKGDGVHRLCWHWHLHPDIYSEWNQASNSWTLIHRENGKKIRVSTGSDVDSEVVKGAVNPILGWYSSVLGSKAPSEVLVYRLDGKLPRELTFSFIIE